MSMVASLRHALIAARNLTEKEEVNEEYVRGQVNLIMDLFGVCPDYVTYTAVSEVITHDISVETGIAIINASNRRLKEIEAKRKEK